VAESGELTWTPVMDFDELWEGDLTGVQVNRTNVLLLNVDGEVRAYLNRCPHQAWPLEEGDLDGRELTCANHHWVFDAVSGKGINPEDCELTAFPVKIEDGTIWVSTP
jgi:toluene monooxygenase system ferredoxin subunit